ncbi:hypothetical protein EIK77_000197 [Talaromyces pinophilus]|nr:hypothetical protein EIK77_000197 [Talaromyces pinophilus]
MWIDRETGLRQDVAHCLLFPLLDQGNTGLQVATDVSVNRILFNANKKATGVEYTISGTKPAVVKARRLVVLASGALGSPQVLERSGVGDKNLLLKLGIQVISDLPGVGSNYQDHNVIFYPYKSSDGVEETIHGVVSWNGLDCVGKLRPTEVASLHPTLQNAWEEDFKPQPEKPLMLIATIAGYIGDHSAIDVGQYFLWPIYALPILMRVDSSITGQSVADESDFDCGFLSDPVDLEKLVWGYKLQREITRRMTYYCGPLIDGHPISRLVLKQIMKL